MWDEENNDNNIIRPCPFCGGEAEEDRSCTEELEYSLECKDCGACLYRDNDGSEDFKLQVIKAWNRRTDG